MNLWFVPKSPGVLMVSPQCTHGIPLVHWTSPGVLMIPYMHLGIPQCTHDNSQCTEHPPVYSLYPPVYWTPVTVLMISPTLIMVNPRCTHDIPPHSSRQAPGVLTIFLGVPNTSRCTHGIPHCTHDNPPVYWTSPVYSWYPPLYS